MSEHGVIYMRGAGPCVEIVCECGELLRGSATTSETVLLSQHIKEATRTEPGGRPVWVSFDEIRPDPPRWWPFKRRKRDAS